MLAGAKSEVLRRRVDHRKKGHLCFTIVCEHRTLDLEAATEQQRDLWVDGLRVYLDDRRTKDCRWTSRVLYSAISNPALPPNPQADSGGEPSK